MNRVKQLLTLLIPPGRFKNALLSSVFGWDIDPKAYIGFSRINIDQLTMGPGAFIGHFNQILNLEHLDMDDGALLIASNTIFGPEKGTYKQTLKLGKNSGILRKCIVDCSADILIGNNVIFAGVRCQLWTHGFDKVRDKFVAEITTGDNIYLGSGAMVLPGVSICDGVSVAAGAVVVKSIEKEGFYAGNPAVFVKEQMAFADRTDLSKIETLSNGKTVYTRK